MKNEFQSGFNQSKPISELRNGVEMSKSGRASKKVKQSINKSDLLKTIDEYSLASGLKLVHTFGKLFGQEDIPLSHLMQAGNIKIPRETAIFNMSSATDCPSKALGICKACVWDEESQSIKSICYAIKAERTCRPAVLPYRRRQEFFWLETSAEEFAKQFLLTNARKVVHFDKLRLNESGDFHSQDCVDKAERISRILSKFGISTYCYTSRDDLDYTKIRSLVINASSFRTLGIVNEFTMVPKGKRGPKGYVKCPMDCTICDRCSTRGSKTWVPQH